MNHLPPSSSFARRLAMLNVPSPNPERNAYARFIPREELGAVQRWSPGGFGGAPRKPARAEPPPPASPPPPGPTPEEMRSRLDANIKADLEAAQKTGYEQGYRDGLAALEGFKKAHAEQMNAQLAQWMRGLDGEFDALHEGLAAGVARVAVQLARQVLRSELRTAPELVSRVAAEAMEAVLHSARHITLHAHPDDLPLVAAGAQEALRARGARLVADADIARGGCRIESDVGGIDARIDSRWARAAAGLIGDIGDDAGGAVSGDLGWHEAPHGRDPQGAA